jgi:hypothetical protein
VTASPELFELKVIVEADGWRDVAAVMATVDEALEPHRDGRPGGRRWSVVAAPLPAGRARELRWFVEEADGRTGEPPATDRMSA